MAFANATIADVTTVVTKGTTPTTLGRQFTSNGIGFIKAECISGDGALITEKQVYIDEETDQLLKRSRLQKDDVLFSIAGVIGRTALVQQRALPANTNQAIAILRPDPGKIIPKFLYYTVRARGFQDHSLGHVVQTAQANVSLGVLSAAPIWLPPIPIQRRIADILSAYDDLIENCQRRIQILEQMARALYREWFVKFRYPGHESVPLVPSPLGEIPQGWEVKKLSELVTTQYGYTESTNVSPVGPKYLRGMDMNKTSYIDWSQVPYCPISEDDKQSYAVKKGDVFVIRMADPGKVGIAEQDVDAVFASYLIRVRPSNGLLRPYFLFHLLDSSAYQGYISGASTGTTRRSASAGVITDFHFALPPKKIVTDFDAYATNFRGALTVLLQQIQNLRRTRDLLLPRLISGQIDLDAA